MDHENGKETRPGGNHEIARKTKESLNWTCPRFLSHRVDINCVHTDGALLRGDLVDDRLQLGFGFHWENLAFSFLGK